MWVTRNNLGLIIFSDAQLTNDTFFDKKFKFKVKIEVGLDRICEPNIIDFFVFRQPQIITIGDWLERKTHIFRNLKIVAVLQLKVRITPTKSKMKKNI